MSGNDLLRAALARAREHGFLGPGPVEAHLAHALGFVSLIRARGPDPERILDLGTGGGVPGLVLADRFADSLVVLLEVSSRRSEFLTGVVSELGWSGRVQVVAQRGEEAGRRDDLRERFTVVTARSFAEPAVTAEIGSAFVEVGGALVVSEPPDEDDKRWPAAPLRELGLGQAARQTEHDAHFVVIQKVAGEPERYPRAVGRPGKRPLW